MTHKNDKSAADPNKVDATKLSLMLAELRLPTINKFWQSFAKRADGEGWTAARFLAALAEYELAKRDRRHIERHLKEAKLLPGKSLDPFDFNDVPMISKAQVNALASGDAWLYPGSDDGPLRSPRRRHCQGFRSSHPARNASENVLHRRD